MDLCCCYCFGCCLNKVKCLQVLRSHPARTLLSLSKLILFFFFWRFSGLPLKRLLGLDSLLLLLLTSLRFSVVIAVVVIGVGAVYCRPCRIYGFLTKREVKIAAYWISSFSVSVHQHAKKGRGHYPAILTEPAKIAAKIAPSFSLG